MKIIVYRSKNMIYRIDLRSKFSVKTDAEIEEAVKRFDNGDRKCSLVEIPEELEEIFNFMLGGEDYKHNADIQSLNEELNGVQCALDGLESDLYGLQDRLDWCKKAIRDLKE